jgi:hypothetical protein
LSHVCNPKCLCDFELYFIEQANHIGENLYHRCHSLISNTIVFCDYLGVFDQSILAHGSYKYFIYFNQNIWFGGLL